MVGGRCYCFQQVDLVLKFSRLRSGDVGIDECLATERKPVREGTRMEVPRSEATTRPDAEQSRTQTACPPEDGKHRCTQRPLSPLTVKTKYILSSPVLSI